MREGKMHARGRGVDKVEGEAMRKIISRHLFMSYSSMIIFLAESLLLLM